MRTQEEIMKAMVVRRHAWESAQELVAPIVLEHGFEPYKATHQVFAPGTTITEVDQNISSIIEVAGWLLEPLT